LNIGNQCQEERGLGSIRWEKKKIEKRFGCLFAYKTKDVDLNWVDVCLLRKQWKDHRKKKAEIKIIIYKRMIMII